MNEFDRFYSRKISPEGPIEPSSPEDGLSEFDKQHLKILESIDLSDREALFDFRVNMKNDALKDMARNDPAYYLRFAKDPEAILAFDRQLDSRYHIMVKLSIQYQYDDLTEILNAGSYEKRTQFLIKKLVEKNTPFTAFYFDLNSFKPFNDKFGHDNGNKYLRRVADILSNIAPQGSLVGRDGGDEFAFLVPGMDSLQAQLLIEKINNILEKEILNVVYTEINERGEEVQEEKDVILRKASIGSESWTPQSSIPPETIPARAKLKQKADKDAFYNESKEKRRGSDVKYRSKKYLQSKLQPKLDL